MTQQNARIKLEGQEAIGLWQKGKDEWNNWVKENPDADVSFESVDFSKYRTRKEPFIRFHSYNFPKGNVNFNYATFGDGNVMFGDATFDDGNVSFSSAIFGDGDVSFSSTTFGNGGIFFNGATFGSGNLSFGCVNFGDGDVLFDGVNFSKTIVSFDRATFGDGWVLFANTVFGAEYVGFNNVNFGDGYISFEGATFSGKTVSFARATFGYGSLHFLKTKFLNETITFSPCKFKGQVIFDSCEFTDNFNQLTFQNAQFEDALSLQNINVPCPIDFRNTKLSNQLSLDGLTCRLNRKREKGFEIIEDKEDIHRFTRLKELAESNKAHEQAMAFHADEQRAKRWVKTGFFGSLMDMVFSEASNYGQSVMRPAFYFIISILIFASLYCGMADKEHQHPNEKVSLVLTVSLANSVPFLSINKNTKEYLLPKLFDKPKLHKKLYWLMGTQALISMMLLFLIGLGLRNRFRI